MIKGFSAEELTNIYNQISKAKKPRKVTGDKYLPQALIFYFLNEEEKAFSTQLIDWLWDFKGRNYGLNPSQLSRKLYMLNSEFPFLNVEKGFYRDNYGRRQKGNLYSLNLDFLEASK